MFQSTNSSWLPPPSHPLPHRRHSLQEEVRRWPTAAEAADSALGDAAEPRTALDTTDIDERIGSFGTLLEAFPRYAPLLLLWGQFSQDGQDALPPLLSLAWPYIHKCMLLCFLSAWDFSCRPHPFPSHPPNLPTPGRLSLTTQPLMCGHRVCTSCVQCGGGLHRQRACGRAGGLGRALWAGVQTGPHGGSHSCVCWSRSH